MKTKHPPISNRNEVAKCTFSFRGYGTFARTVNLAKPRFQPCRNRRTGSAIARILSFHAPCEYDSAMASPGHHHEPVNIQLLVDSIPALIHTARPDGHLDYFNNPWLKYLGASLDDVTGWKWTAYVHPEDVEGILATWRACLASGEIFEYETRVRRANGDYRWMFHRKVPLRDADGDIVKWYGSSLDIDDRRSVEEKLRRNAQELERSEFHLGEGQRLAHMGSWAFDPNGFYYWSPELFRIHGLDPAGKAPSVQDYLDRVHPQDRESMANMIKRIMEDAEPFDATKRIVRPDGEVRYIRCVGVPLLDNRNQKNYVGSAIDVTEHEILTQDLRRREAYLADAQRLSHTGSWAWNVHTRAMFWSEELLRIHGFDPQGSAPTWAQFMARVHPADRAQIEERARTESTTKGWEESHGDFRIVLPDGTIKHLHSVARPGKDSSGEITDIIGTSMDVTEQVLLTQELRRREAYLAEAQRLSHTGSFGWNPGTGEIVWSDESYRIFGYDGSVKPTVESVVQRVHPEDRAGFEEVMNCAFAGALEFEHAYRLLLPDGQVKHVHAIAHVLRDASGNHEYVGAITDITERKTSEDKLRRLVEAGILGIYFASVDGEIVEANKAFLQMLQYDRQDVVSRRLRWAELTPAEWRERDELSMAEFQATGVFQAYEKEYFRKDGSRVPVLIGGASIQSANEGVVFVLDLSEQKRAEEKVRRSESYLAEAQKLSQTGSWAWSPDDDIRYWSEECYRVLSFDPRGGLPRFEEFFQRIHPDDQPGFRELTETAIREKAEWEADYRIVHLGGAVRNIHVVGHPVLTAAGHLDEFVGTVMDVTENKLLTQELRRREAYLTEAQRLSHTGSFGWSPDSGELVWSDETYRIFEYDAKVKPTMDLVVERVHPEDRAEFQALNARVLRGTTQYERAYRLLLPDGRVKHVRVIARVMDHITDRPLYIGTLQDVTESKLAEEALNKARSELAHVARVTSLNALTASMAHEVNQPLAGIITNASTCLRMLQSDPPNIDGARETARRTIRDGNRASDVITRLRALFSRKELALEPLDLNEAAREVIALSLGDLQRDRVILRTELAENLPPVIGDRVQLQQVILNLLRNASDAMNKVEDRPRELLIRTEEDYDTEKDYGDLVRLSVKDAGVGFTPEARDKLFEAFYSTKNDGMGIGLSVSRSIIDAHHGRLWAVPNDGPGATFSFSVPCRAGTSAAAKTAVNPA